MHSHSLHEVRADAFNYVWDNSIPPVLEVESGAEVELHVRDAGDEQIGPDSLEPASRRRVRPRRRGYRARTDPTSRSEPLWSSRCNRS